MCEAGALGIWQREMPRHALWVPMHACQALACAGCCTSTATVVEGRKEITGDLDVLPTGSRTPSVRPTTNRAMVKIPQLSTLLSTAS